MPIDSSVDYKHPIRVVARRTGLSPDVIRAYELAAVSRMDAGQQAHCLIYHADDLGLEAELRSLLRGAVTRQTTRVTSSGGAEHP